MQQNDFSQGSVKKAIIRQALPMIGAQLINVLYNIVDRIYIGRMPDIGMTVLAALGLCFPLIMLVTAFAALAGNGGAPLFSIARGAGKRERASQIMGNAFSLLLLFGIVCIVLGLSFRVPLLRLFGASDDTIGYATDYLTIYLLGSPFVLISLGMNQFINAQGFARIGMVTVAIGAVANILLDPLFIYVLDMGVQGAALATVLSQALSAAWTLYFLTRGKCSYRLEKSAMRLRLPLVKEICALGLSNCTMKLTESAVQIVGNRQLGLFGGDIFITVMTVINSVRQVIMLPMSGFAEGASPVMGFNYGARKMGRVRETFRFQLIVSVVYSFIAWGVVELWPGFFIRVFNSEPQLLTVGVPSVRLYFATFFAMCLQMAGQFSFVALGKAKQATFFSLLRKAFIVVPLALILPYFIGVNGVFVAELVSDLVGSTACFITFMVTIWRRELQAD